MEKGTSVDRPRRVGAGRVNDRTERFQLRTPEESARAVERLALFTYAMAREQAAGLVELLAAPHRGRAAEYLRQLPALDSASRQGRLAREFGERVDAPERLRVLLAEMAPPQRARAYAKLPPYLQNLCPPHGDTAKAPLGGEDETPAMSAFCDRLLKEAVR
jgi:hypothetical protein